MYNYLILDAPEKKLYRDFMSYHRNNETDDYYIVSVNDPELSKYLEEFLERRLN